MIRGAGSFGYALVARGPGGLRRSIRVASNQNKNCPLSIREELQKTIYKLRKPCQISSWTVVMRASSEPELPVPAQKHAGNSAQRTARRESCALARARFRFKLHLVDPGVFFSKVPIGSACNMSFSGGIVPQMPQEARASAAESSRSEDRGRTTQICTISWRCS